MMGEHVEGGASRGQHEQPLASWAAVASVGVGAFALVTTEFLPVGLLPQIARDVGITEGQAGLMVSVPGMVAALSALMTIAVAGRFDRRKLLWLMLGLLAASNVLVATAVNFPMLLAGRLLLGVGVGGFWTIGGSLGPRLRTSAEGPKATAMIFSGVSLGTVAGVPVGALLGNLWGWRMAFAASATIAILVVVVLISLLPRISPQASSGLGAVPLVLKRPLVRVGLLATVLIFLGQFAAYTYIAPFLDQVSHIDATSLSVVLLGYGIAGFCGNLFGGWTAARNRRVAVMTMGWIMASAILMLILMGEHARPASAAVVAWGFAFGMLPIAMQTYLFSAAPEHLESIAALFVSIAQAALGIGALIGGGLTDHLGVASALWFGAGAALLTCLLVGFIDASPVTSTGAAH